jgi:nicotinamidase-related amidase
VPRALEITAVVNALKARKDKFEVVVLTQDWHPKGDAPLPRSARDALGGR